MTDPKPLSEMLDQYRDSIRITLTNPNVSMTDAVEAELAARQRIIDYVAAGEVLRYDVEAGVWVVNMGGILSQGTTREETVAAGHSAVELTVSSMTDRLTEAFVEVRRLKSQLERKAEVGDER